MKSSILTTIAAMAAGGAIVWGVSAAADSRDTGTARAVAAQGPAAMQQRGGPPGGFGTPVTGDAADRAAAAATAKYQGTLEGVMQLQDGSYVVHVMTSSGEYHVLVSKSFQVTGADQGGPGAGGPPQQGGAMPSAPA